MFFESDFSYLEANKEKITIEEFINSRKNTIKDINNIDIQIEEETYNEFLKLKNILPYIIFLFNNLVINTSSIFQN